MSENILDYFRFRYVDENNIKPVDVCPIAICTPMYNSEPFLIDYLKTILALDYPREYIGLYFTIQGDDKTYDIMCEFQELYGNEYRQVIIEKVDQIKGGDIPHIRNVVYCRNLLANWSSPFPVLFIDHDNNPPPGTIHRLKEDIELGADIAAGVYVFYKRGGNNPADKGKINFTAFFLNNGELGSVGLSNGGLTGIMPKEIFRKRIWVDAVAMGTTLIKREILDEFPFIVPEGKIMSDDTAYCMQVREKGYRFIADFGLMIPHWGYDINFIPTEHSDLVGLNVNISHDMTARRKNMHEQGVYVR